VTYLFCGSPMLLSPIWASLRAWVSLPPLPSWASMLNPLRMVFLAYWEPGSDVVERQAVFLGACLVLSFALVVLAIACLRSTTMRQMGQGEKSRKPSAK